MITLLKMKARYHLTERIVKINKYKIRFCFFFVTFLLLHEKVCAFSSAFFKFISALSRLSHIDKKFVQKFYV